MAEDNMAVRFVRMIRIVPVVRPVFPNFDGYPDREIARIKRAIALLPKHTRDVLLMHRFKIF